jgi:hypothetical protein
MPIPDQRHNAAAPDPLAKLNEYVMDARAWHRSINLNLSERTKRVRGQKAETAYQNLIKEIIKVQQNDKAQRPGHRGLRRNETNEKTQPQ